MSRAYLFAYSIKLGTRDEIKACLNTIPQVKYWRSDIAHAFYIISEENAETLAKLIREQIPKGRFIITEISDHNRYGWLSKESWHLIQKKQPMDKDKPSSA